MADAKPEGGEKAGSSEHVDLKIKSAVRRISPHVVFCADLGTYTTTDAPLGW